MYGESTEIVCINLHDNEGTSVQAAGLVLENKGGLLIRIDNYRQRIIRFKLRGQTFAFDPNRMFSRAGIEQTLRENRHFSKFAVDEIEKFAGRMIELIPDSNSCIIALHNNTNDAFCINSYLPGEIREQDAKAVNVEHLEDVDDLALTTDSLLYCKMVESKYNMIWQDNQLAKKDGSLSVYCGEKNLRYINIETQHGKVVKYAEMLERLFDILTGEKIRKAGTMEIQKMLSNLPRLRTPDFLTSVLSFLKGNRKFLVLYTSQVVEA
jgi:hypothetical protein